MSRATTSPPCEPTSPHSVGKLVLTIAIALCAAGAHADHLPRGVATDGESSWAPESATAPAPQTSDNARRPRESGTAPTPQASGAAPLLLVISVDQMRADYLERFGPSLTGGFRRLLDEGTVFTNALHGHAITATAPGHATILSGLYPRDSGIIDNTWYDRVPDRRERAANDPDYELVGMDVPDDGPGGSPKQFKGTSLVGWLKQQNPRTRAVSISRKDRTAVLTAPEAEHAYWFHGSGSFITSTYYRDEVPDWVEDFNESDWLGDHLGGKWELSRPEVDYLDFGSRPDDYEGERGARGFGNVFPHQLPDERRPLATRILTTPSRDSRSDSSPRRVARRVLRPCR